MLVVTLSERNKKRQVHNRFQQVRDEEKEIFYIRFKYWKHGSFADEPTKEILSLINICASLRGRLDYKY